MCDDVESTCGHPCDSDDCCEECAEYWQRMEQEKYWDRDKHKWTKKGWREIIRNCGGYTYG